MGVVLTLPKQRLKSPADKANTTLVTQVPSYRFKSKTSQEDNELWKFLFLWWCRLWFHGGLKAVQSHFPLPSFTPALQPIRPHCKMTQVAYVTENWTKTPNVFHQLSKDNGSLQMQIITSACWRKSQKKTQGDWAHPQTSHQHQMALSGTSIPAHAILVHAHSCYFSPSTRNFDSLTWERAAFQSKESHKGLHTLCSQLFMPLGVTRVSFLEEEANTIYWQKNWSLGLCILIYTAYYAIRGSERKLHSRGLWLNEPIS